MYVHIKLWTCIEQIADSVIIYEDFFSIQSIWLKQYSTSPQFVSLSKTIAACKAHLALKRFLSY